MEKPSRFIKAEAYITAAEENAVLHRKVAQVSSSYLKRHGDIFVEEHSYFKQFLEELLGMLERASKVNETKDLSGAKYLVSKMIEAQERLIKLSEKEKGD